jgi:hypothetical protein
MPSVFARLKWNEESVGWCFCIYLLGYQMPLQFT